MRCLVIPTDGPCFDSDSDPATIAKELLATSSLDVVMARALGRDPLHVLHIDDWGKTKELPLNRKAWALYGGSPIYGLAVLSADSGGPLDQHVVTLVSDDEFPDPATRAAMDQWLEENP